MREILKKSIGLIKKDWKRLFWFELLYKLAFVVIIWPVCSLLWRIGLKISGIGYVSLDRMTRAMFNPVIIITMLIIGCVLVFTLIYEISVLLISYKYSYFNKKLSFTQMLVLGVEKTINIFRPYNLIIIFVSVCLLCLMNYTMDSSITKAIKIPEYIQMYIDSKQVLNITLKIIFLVVFLANISLLFIYNCFFYENKRAVGAIKESIGLTKKRYFRVLKNFLGIKFLLSLAVGLLIGMAIIIYVIIMYLYLHNNAVVAILWTLYTIFTPIFGGVFTSLTVVVDFAVISSMYYKYSNNHDDTFSKREKRKEYRLLAFVAKGKGLFKFLIIIGSLLTIVVIFIISYVVFDSNIYDDLYSKIEITAHRGNSTVTMPNTIPAFKEAIKEGADYGELDVRETRDNVIVVTHDASLKEMTGQDINVRDLTYDELQKIPCIEVNGNKCTVPKLEDVIKVCKGKIKLNIEIKTGNNDSENFVPDVVKVIEDTNFVDKCVVTSLDYGALIKVKECNPKIKTGYIMAVAMGEFYNLPNVDFFSMESTFVNGRVVDRAHKLNKQIYVWTVNDSDSLKKCVDLEVDNIITDNVAGAKSVIATHGNDVFSILLNQLKESDNSKENIKKTNRILEDVTGIEGA